MKNNPSDLKAYINTTLDNLSQYLSDSQMSIPKVLHQASPPAIIKELELDRLLEEGLGSAQGLDHFLKTYLKHSQHMHHPQYMGHQVAVPHVASGVSDLIHGVINNPMGIYEMGPASATLERVMVNWMLNKVGWLKSDDIYSMDYEMNGGDGILTHGGSLANLTALLAARAKANPEAWTEGNDPRLCILAPAVSHYCISRSASIMGMGSKSIKHVPVDALEVMRVEQVRKAHKEAIAEGKQIMALVANACATATGLYDPLDEIGHYCNEQGLWFHVDGAHGTSALLSEKHTDKMKGIARADSMIWDAHKMLRTSALCAAVLVKDYKKLHATFRQEGSYLFFDKDQIGFDLLSHTIECTKAPLGTKLFLVLAAEGEKALGEYVDYTYALASKFYDLIKARPLFDCDYQPQSNILCFRYNGGDADSDNLQLEIRNKLTQQGNFYITTSLVSGRRYLRVTLMNDLTTEAHLEGLLDEIEVIANSLRSL